MHQRWCTCHRPNNKMYLDCCCAACMLQAAEHVLLTLKVAVSALLQLRGICGRQSELCVASAKLNHIEPHQVITRRCSRSRAQCVMALRLRRGPATCKKCHCKQASKQASSLRPASKQAGRQASTQASAAFAVLHLQGQHKVQDPNHWECLHQQQAQCGVFLM